MNLDFFIFILLINIRKLEILVIKFEKILDEKPFNFSKNKIENLIYTNILIGTPMQKIKSFISLNKGTFYISDSYIPKEFNKNLSSTFKFESLSNIEFNLEEDFNSGLLSKDIIQCKNVKGENVKITNLTFIYATKYKNNSNLFPSGLGLMLKTLEKKKKYNFLYQLKENNIISSYTFTIKFYKENYGEIIIGDYPHKYNDNFFSGDFKYTKSLEFDHFFQWKFEIDQIINNDVIIQNKIPIIISINYGTFVGNSKYLEEINHIFFNDYINKKLCEFKLSHNELMNYYECNDNINILDFPKLKFYDKIMNYTFEFDYNDLFLKKDNKLYFLITFRTKDFRDNWIFGVIFLKKYQIIFDQEREIIGLYINSTKEKKNDLFKILTIICLFIIVILVGILIKTINKKRKIRANELEENFEYISERKLI